MHFASDNTVGASPKILAAIVEANLSALPSYGADEHTNRAKRLLGETFECDLAACFVTTGTAANALALGAVTPPGGVIFCHEGAHIIEEECAAPEFYTHAGKLVGVPGANGKIDPDALRETLGRFPRGLVRQAQPACLSLSQATEAGTLYAPAELKRLTDLAHEAGLLVHMDGARFGNAVAALGCSAADVSWKAGIDILSFGATKNGALACEAIVTFDRGRAAALPFLQKRGGHILSKGRFLGAQMAAYLDERHWLDLACAANAQAARLADGLSGLPGVRLPWPCQANEIFPILPVATAERLRSEGAVFYDWDSIYLSREERSREGEVFVRLICSYATDPGAVDAFLRVAGS